MDVRMDSSVLAAATPLMPVIEEEKRPRTDRVVINFVRLVCMACTRFR